MLGTMDSEDKNCILEMTLLSFDGKVSQTEAVVFPWVCELANNSHSCAAEVGVAGRGRLISQFWSFHDARKSLLG